ncbi:MAG: CPBP family intramembrane metalloprotease [Spirochaetales bacterium]|nr:CPBP family intramembrane metalloprotease [Spirochaetales bacterium]
MLEKAAFFLALALFVFIWGRLLKWGAERSRALGRLAFMVMSRTRFGHDQVKAVLLGLLYAAFGVFGTVVFVAWSGADARALFSFRPGSLALAALCFAAMLMIMDLLLGLVLPALRSGMRRSPEREIAEAPWIDGIARMGNRTLAALAPGVSGFFEELFFRGALLACATGVAGLDAVPAVALVTAAFVVQQLLQLRSLPQAVIIGTSCVVISAIGSFATLHSGSVVPAALAHAAFAVFYVRWSSAGSRNGQE